VHGHDEILFAGQRRLTRQRQAACQAHSAARRVV
jgi:hypothetical protein